MPPGRSQLQRGFPAGGVKTVLAPAGKFQPGVVILAVPQRIEGDRAGSGAEPAPGGGGQPEFAAGVEFQRELALVEPGGVIEIPHIFRGAVEPAGAENHADGVETRLQVLRHIVADEAHTTVVDGHDGVEHLIADPAAVQVQLIKSDAGDQQNGGGECG